MIVHNAAVHRLLKAQNTEGCLSSPALGALVVDDNLTHLVAAICDTYNKRTSQRTGSFGDPDQFQFPARLTPVVNGTADFFEFTLWALERLRIEMADIRFATGGYLFFCEYTTPQAGRFFFVAKLTDAVGAIFDEQMQRVVEATYLNVDKLQQVGRVNIAHWNGNVGKYLTFVSAREGGQASNYFVDFLGCDQAISNTEETNKLVKVLREFCENQNLADEEATHVKRRAFDYATALPKGTPISLAALANAAWPGEPQLLTAFINGHPDAPSDDIVPTVSGLKGLIKLKLKMTGMTLEMTREFKTDHNVEITNERDLVIHNVSQDVIDELLDQ